MWDKEYLDQTYNKDLFMQKFSQKELNDLVRERDISYRLLQFDHLEKIIVKLKPTLNLLETYELMKFAVLLKYLIIFIIILKFVVAQAILF